MCGEPEFPQNINVAAVNVTLSPTGDAGTSLLCRLLSSPVPFSHSENQGLLSLVPRLAVFCL